MAPSGQVRCLCRHKRHGDAHTDLALNLHNTQLCMATLRESGCTIFYENSFREEQVNTRTLSSRKNNRDLISYQLLLLIKTDQRRGLTSKRIVANMMSLRIDSIDRF